MDKEQFKIQCQNDPYYSKLCSGCVLYKPSTMYSKDIRYRDGLSCRCKQCSSRHVQQSVARRAMAEGKAPPKPRKVASVYKVFSHGHPSGFNLVRCRKSGNLFLTLRSNIPWHDTLHIVTTGNLLPDKYWHLPMIDYSREYKTGAKSEDKLES